MINKQTNKMKRLLKVLLNTDVYKTGHRSLYPEGITKVFSNFTPRSGNWAKPNLGFVVAHGMEYVVKKIRHKLVYLIGRLTDIELEQVADEYSEVIKRTIGVKEYNTSHLLELFEYVKKHNDLPLEFRAVAEGTKVEYKTPVLTIHNTDDKFPWLVNYLETWISSELWPIITASTKAYGIKQQLLKFAEETGTSPEFVPYQAHDFSFRGMEGTHGAKLVGIGHLQHFLGSDNFPAMLEVNKGASVIATEHSCMCAGTKEGEFETYKRLITQNPEGILSIVSDTWNIYNVVDVILPKLKDEILARNGKLVIRPDSGDAITQLLGDKTPIIGTQDLPSSTLRHQINVGLFGLIEKHFGSTTNEKGFKVLPIGFLWGDGMTPEKITEVFTALKAAGYASENLAIGVGSYTYQLNTRDTYGFAMKATYVEVNGEGREIMKDPITDSGVKKSATGLLAIFDGTLKERATWEEVNSDENELKII